MIVHFNRLAGLVECRQGQIASWTLIATGRLQLKNVFPAATIHSAGRRGYSGGMVQMKSSSLDGATGTRPRRMGAAGCILAAAVSWLAVGSAVSAAESSVVIER